MYTDFIVCSKKEGRKKGYSVLGCILHSPEYILFMWWVLHRALSVHHSKRSKCPPEPTPHTDVKLRPVKSPNVCSIHPPPNAINYTVKIPYFHAINFFPSSIPTNNQRGKGLDREKVKTWRLALHAQSTRLESRSQAKYAFNVQNLDGHRHVETKCSRANREAHPAIQV